MFSGNVTRDPLSHAVAVAKPRIREIRSLKSGQILDARRFIEALRYDRLIQLRTGIQAAMDLGQPRFACAICGATTYIASSPVKKFFFRHRIEDGSCPASRTDGRSEAEIRAMKYRSAQESAAHRRLKALIERSLHADGRFEDVGVETTWRSADDPTLLRRPDIQARKGDLRLAFEAQLSTTFLDVVVGRKAFYRAQGALLIWILPYFDPAYRRLTVDDMLFNNNANVLVVDEETTAMSVSSGRLVLRCAYRRTLVHEGMLTSAWESRLVGWDDLHLDLEGQRVYAFDCEEAERALAASPGIPSIEAADAEPDDARLREQILVGLARERADPCRPLSSPTCVRFRDALARHDSVLDLNHDLVTDAVCGVSSALAGRPVGYRFERLIQVAHHIADRRPMALAAFGLALRHSGHQQTLERQDRSGRWALKAAALRDRWRSGDTAFLADPALLSLLGFLFPQLAGCLLGTSRGRPDVDRH
ncbi:hypothetical protein AX289_25345 [Methylorubrum populi]|nr:hypothetical protein AX289_25345 [Methylorubrum populi]